MELMRMKMKDEKNFKIYNSYLRTYDLYGTVCNAFDAGKSITRASGRGLGPGNQEFFGPCEMHGIEPSGECRLGPKKVEISMAKLLPLALVMDFPASKALRKWRYQSEVLRQFYVHDL